MQYVKRTIKNVTDDNKESNEKVLENSNDIVEEIKEDKMVITYDSENCIAIVMSSKTDPNNLVWVLFDKEESEKLYNFLHLVKLER